MNTIENGLPVYELLSLDAVLQALGHEPVARQGEELLYAPVFGAQTRNRFAFRVNSRLNTWYDSALGKGGKLIDFARSYWPELSDEDLAHRLGEIQCRSWRKIGRKDRPRRKRRAIKLPHYRIERIGPLGFDQPITDFLIRRGLWDDADLNLREVYYYRTDPRGNRKNFCAAGWPTENGGWEVRAPNYTGCIGPRGMTFFSLSQLTLAIFPRYGDYLRARRDTCLLTVSVLVLNHADFLSASITRARQFERVLCYIDEKRDGDPALAKACTDQLPHVEIRHL